MSDTTITNTFRLHDERLLELLQLRAKAAAKAAKAVK